jgi:hypothetical protein
MSCSSDKHEINNLSVKQKTYSETAKFKPVFIPLPPGDITPKGWIKDWAEDASKGITAHLDEYSASVFEGWTGLDFFEVMGAYQGGTNWPLEIAGHWLEGALGLSIILNDTALFNKVSKRLDLVVNGVLNGGESFIFWEPKSVLIDNDGSKNNWGHHIMGRTLVTYYHATHDKKILQALVKIYKHFPLQDIFYDSEIPAYGSLNIEPMIETYLLSGEKAILDTVLAFSRRPAYKSVSERWSRGDFMTRHGGGYYEIIRSPALLYAWTGNKTDLDATLKAIEWGDKRHLLPIGVCSGEEYLAGIGATRNVETCNITYASWAFLSMLRITGDNDYAGRIERIFFNAAPAPVARDFKTMCYYQSSNRYSNTLPSEEPRHPGKASYRFTKIGHPVQCCVANINRNIPVYVSNMWMATMDNGLAAVLYGPCNVKTIVADKVPVEIDCQTSYPFEETINISVNPAKEIEFPVYFSIPAWCENPEIKINGTEIDVIKEINGFFKVSRLWKKSDKIILYFPMTAKMLKGKETPYPRIAYFEHDNDRMLAKDTTINSPYGCVYYGPLLFSLAIADENPNKEMADAKFNYALDVTSNDAAGQIEVIRKPMPEKWTWSLDAPVQLKVQVREFDWKPTESQPLPEELVKKGEAKSVVLIPYGCTKFRVSMFPLTETSWDFLSDISTYK